MQFFAPFTVCLFFLCSEWTFTYEIKLCFDKNRISKLLVYYLCMEIRIMYTSEINILSFKKKNYVSNSLICLTYYYNFLQKFDDM